MPVDSRHAARSKNMASLIGPAGMGEVDKTHAERLNRTVAIKWLIAGDVDQFQSEARAIAAINDPQICQSLRRRI